MHRSCLAGFIIDCRTDDLPGAATFWGGALGLPPQAPRPCLERLRADRRD